ncbi:MAG: modulated LuxR family transcriptional regulator [Marmoricola sp.]|nr:modulated LuxR family transcriptional regulator [Marmoricola sp.]
MSGRSDAAHGDRPAKEEQDWQAVRSRLGSALRRLGDAPSTDALRAAAPRELCEACGFTRAMISAVHGNRWVPLVLYTQDSLDPEAAAFRAFVASDVEIPLATMLAETEMVRRRKAVLIDDALLDRRTYKPIISIAQSTGYVAAPLLVDGRTIGFMHADRVGQARAPGEADRRTIAAFAAELAVLYQQQSWTELLLGRHRGFEETMSAAKGSLVRFTAPSRSLGASIEVTGERHDGTAPAPRRDALLTAREREILELVAEGATNATIASRLTLSEDTIKTHMRGVLRKLRVSSRSAAVARYVRLRGSGDE